ncbi:thermonuclease family protein [Sphingomonas glacialis]|uniref:Thermonuclease family protein n=1 Tax=Sphingomonas glacialis TaxID=658225 RepID=A0A502G4B4_9SPHN|nr:thermonuclease family protein [Sphingomonas glacialis]TPG56699.1 thermonuclease family protein [Sphingomonas glacialis]
MLSLIAPPPAIFSCTVTRVHDGDGPIWCSNGTKIRVAGIQAPDLKNTVPCREGRAEYACSNVAAERSRVVVERLTLHQAMTCQPMGTSYSRVVARCTLQDGRSLSCAILAAGAAVRWDKYWVRYHMGECR